MHVHPPLITILLVSNFFLMQSIVLEVVEETTEKNIRMETSSIHSESTGSQLDQIFTLQSKSHPHVSLFYAIHISNIFG